MVLTIEASKNEDGTVKKTVKVEGDDFRFYEIIGLLELTKKELCDEDTRRSEKEQARRQA